MTTPRQQYDLLVRTILQHTTRGRTLLARRTPVERAARLDYINELGLAFDAIVNARVDAGWKRHAAQHTSPACDLVEKMDALASQMLAGRTCDLAQTMDESDAAEAR